MERLALSFRFTFAFHAREVRFECDLGDGYVEPATGALDDALMEALLVKLFYDRQLKVPADVVRYIVDRMERSPAAARDMVANLDSLSLAERRKLTVPLVRRVLSEAPTEDI